MKKGKKPVKKRQVTQNQQNKSRASYKKTAVKQQETAVEEYEEEDAEEQSQANTASKSQNKRNLIISAVIIVFCLLLYGNTIPFGYVFDDPIVVTRNEFTKDGFKGIGKILTSDSFAGIFGDHGGIIPGGRYRPLSVVTFAIEYQFLGENPHVTHAINVLMYAFTGILMFLLLSKIFGQKGIYKNPDIRATSIKSGLLSKWYLSVPFVATVLWVAHPIHTEVVANIKERDDIMALLGCLITLWYSLKYFETPKIKYLIVAGLTFFLSYMSKENAVTFLAVIPLTIYYFVEIPKAKKKSKKTVTPKQRYIFLMVALLIPTIVFLIMRVSILGNAIHNNIPQKLMNDPFLHTTTGEKYATIFYSLILYMKLMFFPHPLTVDYYPFQIPIINWSLLQVVVPLLIYLALGAFALLTIRKRAVFTYGIWFYLATFSIFSNIFFTIGTFVTERFLYISVFGFCLIAAFFLLQKLPYFIKNKTKVELKPLIHSSGMAFLLFVVIGLYSFKTIDRNSDWKTDKTLFEADLKSSPKSAKSNHVVGELYLQEALQEKDEQKRNELLEKSIELSRKGVEIHPRYVRCLHNLGVAIYERNKEDYKEAMPYFIRVIENQPYYEDTYRYVFTIMDQIDNNVPKNLKYKINTLETCYKLSQNHYKVNSTLGTYYLLINQLDKAYFYLDRAVRIESKLSKAGDYNNLGVIFSRKGELAKSGQMFEKAHELKPEQVSYLNNTIAIYSQLKNMQKVNYYAQKLQQLKNK